MSSGERRSVSNGVNIWRVGYQERCYLNEAVLSKRILLVRFRVWGRKAARLFTWGGAGGPRILYYSAGVRAPFSSRPIMGVQGASARSYLSVSTCAVPLSSFGHLLTFRFAEMCRIVSLYVAFCLPLIDSGLSCVWSPVRTPFVFRISRCHSCT